jgi:two-component system CheB/CheR fusion protein
MEKKERDSKISIKETENKTFPIVGIGASAGGLEAIEGFFSHMPFDRNIAFVIIQHLDPKHKSIMGSLLTKYTKMKILEVKDGMKIEPNCVYLNPPNKNVAIMSKLFHLMELIETYRINLPIDYFFRSLSEDQGEKAICIILSGTGTDGTLGLKAIKGAGGMTMAQEEKQAQYAGMPRSAIDTGLVDFILPVEKMPKELIKYVQHPYIGGPEKIGTPEQQFQNYLQKIFLLIRAGTGHDFSNYKQNTTRRRVERRMAVHQISRIADYLRYLQQNTAEVEALFKDLLIRVTNFFRDPKAFEVLKEKVIPDLLEKKETDTPVRIWVPGCATGEEAYSLAMIVFETMERLKKNFILQIFATDIDPEAIEYARRGVYPESIAADVSEERLKRFFVKEENTYTTHLYHLPI